MAGNILVQSLEKSVPSVAVFSIKSESKTTILQVELEEIILLRRQAREAQEASDRAETSLRAKLVVGAEVEDGVHTARLKDSFRKSISWKDVVVRLAERLEMNGEAYCERVLASTKPSRTSTLVIE